MPFAGAPEGRESTGWVAAIASQCITPALPSPGDGRNDGIGLAHFDLERLGLEEGEEILPGITIHADSGGTGNFRVLCDGEHDEGKVESEEEVVEAVATQTVPAVAPGVSPGEIPFGG